MCVCANVHAKQTDLFFAAQICLKMDLGLAIEKATVGKKISSLDILCVPVFSQNEQLWIFLSKFVKKKIRVGNWEK